MKKLTERSIQRAYFDWVRMMRNSDERFWLITHFPAGSPDKTWNSTQKADGCDGNWPDVQIMVTRPMDPRPIDSYRGTRPGMFIEFKLPGKKPRADQDQIAKLLMAQGYLVYLFHDAESAIKQTKFYLGMPI